MGHCYGDGFALQVLVIRQASPGARSRAFGLDRRSGPQYATVAGGLSLAFAADKIAAGYLERDQRERHHYEYAGKANAQATEALGNPTG